MKLTREQISQLSDVELNRAMIWCYPDKRNYDGYYDEYMGYDYLTDYNLTMPLAIKLGVCLTLDKDYDIWDASETCDLNAMYVDDIEWGEIASNKDPLRAICEVLLMIAMEREA